jgi:hypothetical protein
MKTKIIKNCLLLMFFLPLLGRGLGGGLCYGQDAGMNRWFISAKTNVALWGLDAIANAEAEFFLPVTKDRAFSINLPVMYSPYTVSNNWKYRLLVVQPEFRWWLSNAERWWLRQERPSNTHFVGLHAHLAWFNVAVNSHDRYQGKEGTALPLWGAGVSYGYAMLLPWWKGCGIEFTLGVGYAHITYDQYHNDVPNGAKYATGVDHYWGITRLGISLIHHFN